MWEWQRQAWARPTTAIHALRRARARAAYNRKRQQWATERRRLLARLLRQNGFDPLGDLSRAGNEGVYRQYYQETGRSRATFYRDLATLRAAGRFGMTAVAAVTGLDTARAHQEHESAAQSVQRLLQAATPCPTCGRVRGLPARTRGGPVWFLAYQALAEAVAELPAEYQAYLRVRAAAHYQNAVRRGTDPSRSPPPPPP